MADVQIDNGNFTQIANILLEKISSAKLNGCQHSIVLTIWRYTYGFKRKEHDLSASFIAKATGYNQRQVQRDLIVLVNRNIITQRSISGITRILSFNKDYESWSTYGELADGEKADGEKADGQSTDGELAVPPTANQTGVTYGELADQEIKSFKQNSKEIINIVPFEEIITYLNQKAGTKFKHNTVNTKKHINARWNENYQLTDFQTVIDKKCAEWLGNDMERYLCPDTLFGTKFEKYLNQKIGLISNTGGKQGTKQSVDDFYKILERAANQ